LQLNLVIRFYLGYLGTKSNTLTRWWDVYSKGGNTGYATVTFHNFKPIFTQVQVTALLFPFLHTATVIDLNILHQDICLALLSDPTTIKYITADGQ